MFYFDCPSCKGMGVWEIGDCEDNGVWENCIECDGEGQIEVDEED